MDPGYIDDPQHNETNENATRNYGGRLALRYDVTDNLRLKLSVLGQNKSASTDSMEDVAFGGTPLTGDYQHSRPARQRRLFFENEVDNDKFSQEIRLASNGDGPLHYMAGLFYTSERSVLLQNIDPADPVTGALSGSLPTLLHSRIPSTYREVAAYANVTSAMTPELSLQLGGRASHIEQTCNEEAVGILAADAMGASHDHPVTYTVTPTYHFTPDMMVYARLATGYRAGGPNPSQGGDIPTAYAPDRTVNYEVGTKDSLFDHKLTFDATLFRINWYNIQISETDPVSSSTFFANAGNAHSQGVEGAIGLVPLSGLHLAGNISLSQAVLETACRPVPRAPPAPAACCPTRRAGASASRPITSVR